MGPCVSDFGCSEGSRASLTDAAVWLATPGAHTTLISHLAVSLHLTTVWPEQQTRREDVSVQAGGKQMQQKHTLIRLVVCYQETGSGGWGGGFRTK